MLSRFDTFGLTVLEAMAASLPVVISRNVGARDLVGPGENGYVVDGRNARAVGACLLSLADDQTLEKMGGRALAAARRCGWEIMVARLKHIYHEVHRVPGPHDRKNRHDSR
jgi:UDP-glucose:(heptosyl)LPS alpha-1,3-glucosyltransferase